MAKVKANISGGSPDADAPSNAVNLGVPRTKAHGETLVNDSPAQTGKVLNGKRYHESNLPSVKVPC